MTERERRLCYWMTILPPMSAAEAAGYTLEDAAEAAAFLKTEEAREQIRRDRREQAAAYETFATLDAEALRLAEELPHREVSPHKNARHTAGDAGEPQETV